MYSISQIEIINIVDGIDGTNGIGIIDTIVEYAVSPSGTDIPGGPLSDENGNALYDSEGFLSINAWHEEIPNVAPGEYLWTKTTTTYSDGTKGVSYSVARNGQNPYTVVLSNESHTFSANTETAIEGTAICDIIAYDGQEALEVNVGEISGIPEGMSVEIQGNHTRFAKFIVSVTEEMTSRNGTLSIPIKINEFEFIKFFTYSLAMAGENSVAYRLHLSVPVLARTNNGFYNPPTISMSATEQEGSGAAKPYLGRFKIETTLDNENWSQAYVSNEDESTKSYAMPSDIAALKITLYRSGATDEILDYQTVPVVNDGTSGNGIEETVKEYALSDSGTVPPGGPYTDGDNAVLFDNIGGFMNSVWSSEMPEEVPQGLYLWTRVTFRLSDGNEEVVYNISRDGKDGINGTDGIYVVRQVTQFYASSSKTALMDGNWSYVDPAEDIEEGQFLWRRFENIMSDGSILYSEPVYESILGGIYYVVKETEKKIESKIWQTDFTNTLNEYDNTVTQSIRDRVNETVSDLDGIHTTISDIQSSIGGDGDTSIVKRVQKVEDTASEHTRIISEDILGDDPSSVKSIAQQAADHFSWLVTNPATATDTTFELAERVAILVAEKINMKGLVTFDGLNPDVQNKIDDAQKVLNDIKGGIVSTKTEYAQSGYNDKPPGGPLKDGNGNVIYDIDGVPLVDGTWSETIPEIIPGQYLWTRISTTYTNGDIEYTYVVSRSGENGLMGENGSSPVSIIPYWYLNSYEPTSTPITNPNEWATSPQEYEDGKYYWQCSVTTYSDGTVTCSEPIINRALNEAIFNSATALNTAKDVEKQIKDVYSPFIANATTILTKWTGDAKLEETTINGGYIATNTITAEHLATNAIMSRNYVPGTLVDGIMRYSGQGSFLDLANGNFYTPNFSVNADKAYLNGEIVAASGRIGDEGNSYWQIGTTFDQELDSYAALISVGNARIQTGKFTLSNTSLNTLNGGEYLKENGKNVWYDYGLHAPDRSVLEGDAQYPLENNFLYIRKITTQPTQDTPESEWTYLFKVDREGNIWEGGQKLSDRYAALGDASNYITVNGGQTINGTLTVTGLVDATAKAANKVTHTLTINNQGWDGSADLTINTSQLTLAQGTGISITSSGNTSTIGHSNNIAAGSAAGSNNGTILTNGGDFYIPVINYDGNGHITSVSRSKLTLPTINAGQDDQGQDISSTYVQISGNQSITGLKTFANTVIISKDTESTNKSTGALIVSGGIGAQGQVNAQTFRINEHVTIEYNSSTNSLDFKFL